MRASALRLTARFQWKLLPALLVVALGDWLFYQRQLHGGYFGLFTLAVLGALLIGRPVVRHDPRAWLALGMATLFSGALMYDASLLAWVLFWIAVAMASLLPATARFDDGWRWFQRLVLHGLRAPLVPLFDLKRLFKVRAAGRSGRYSVRATLGTFALPMIGSAVILSLFAAANPLIERFFNAIMLPELSNSLFIRGAFWGLIFISIWSLLRPRLARHLLPTVDRRDDLALPGVSVASITLSLIVFNLIFAAQNLMDAAWLWGWAPMPEGMTMADYAHRGAYPLIATALLAALFVLVTLRPGSDTARMPAIRRLVLLWIAQNIILVASSMLRTVDYIEAYSLTWLRIAALIWMALVGFGLATICWRLLRNHTAAWLININLAAVGLVLAVVSLVDLGATAAQWNVRHAREVGGRGVALDLCYLDGLGDSALLPLLELEQHPNLAPVFRERVQAVLARRLYELAAGQQRGWTLLGQRRLTDAQRIMAERAPVGLTPGARGCNGALIPPPPPPPRTDNDESKVLPALTGEIGK
ncbi:hypothetical protein ASE85_20840 [Sphingobium sp. Leaf26]|uniref:DUF4153 domain-containing protein n=1 Tax=Sphingobium sp. Leaf26 TaxID=1735693 RepID=UPI0006F76518|nr:DUF4173 domain-containing protein [Sphingobium sp. Leaf26]KQN04245.1 hypothetical protein ASE85_20840 [Sphingobium sp. Leaf26]